MLNYINQRKHPVAILLQDIANKVKIVVSFMKMIGNGMINVPHGKRRPIKEKTDGSRRML